MHLQEIDPNHVVAVFMGLRMVIPPIASAIRKWLRRTIVIIVIERKG